MNKIILHRGNTLLGVENSIEAMNPDVSSLKNEGCEIPQIVIFEVDVIARSPYLIHHTTDDIVENIFDFDIDGINKKHVWELTQEQIEHCRHKTGKRSKPMILEELLELAKKNKYKLYLDVKVPDYQRTNMTNYIFLYGEIHGMFDILNKYKKYDLIDCVVSFSTMASIMFKIYASIVFPSKFPVMFKDTFNLNLGVFGHMYFKNVILNKIYMYLLILIISPKIISYDINMIEKDISLIHPKYQCYVWTMHKSELSSKNNFLVTHNLVPVIDMFDKS